MKTITIIIFLILVLLLVGGCRGSNETPIQQEYQAYQQYPTQQEQYVGGGCAV